MTTLSLEVKAMRGWPRTLSCVKRLDIASLRALDLLLGEVLGGVITCTVAQTPQHGTSHVYTCCRLHTCCRREIHVLCSCKTTHMVQLQ